MKEGGLHSASFREKGSGMMTSQQRDMKSIQKGRHFVKKQDAEELITEGGEQGGLLQE